MFVEHRSTDFGMAEVDDPGRRRRHRLGHHQRPHGVRLRQGLHGLRRLAVRGARAEDHQDPGHGAEDARAGDRPVRRRRRTHPGGRRGARRLRRGLQAQRRRLERRHPADLGDHGPVRRRRRLLAGDDRLHLHGPRPLLHVRHRPGRREDRHQRGRHAPRNSAAPRCTLEIIDRRRRLRQRRRGAPAGAPADGFPAPRTTSTASPKSRASTIPTAATAASTRSSPTTRTSPTT